MPSKASEAPLAVALPRGLRADLATRSCVRVDGRSGASTICVVGHAVQRPSEQLLLVADLLDEVVRAFLAHRPPAPGRWEALDDARLLSNLAVRQIESVSELGRIDEVLLPGAWSCARSAFEIGMRFRWLLEPDDPFEREARWLSRIAEEERLNDQVADRVQVAGGDPSWFRDRAASIRDFREGVTAQLPPGTKVPGIPSVEQMALASSNHGSYIRYKQGSQHVHGTHSATEIYRRNLGTAKEFGERVTSAMWAAPMGLCWITLISAGTLLIDRLAGDVDAFLGLQLVRDTDDALAALRDESSDGGTTRRQV
jgi:hypothetical protein